MAEGLIVVPLYSRQAPAELVAMMKDCTPSLVCCGDAALRDAIAQSWAEAPPQFLFDEIFAGVDGVQLERPQVGNDRSGDDHLYVGDFGRSQGRGADGGECGLHAGADGGAIGAVDVWFSVGHRVRRDRIASFIICRLLLRRRGLRC